MFERVNILERYTTATEKKQIDLPIDPISHLIVSLDGYNTGDEATLAEILAFINNINISKMGKTIYDLEGEEIYAQNCWLNRRQPMLTGKMATDNYHRCLSLIIPFGRFLYNPSECLPATKKGELTLTLDMTVPATSWDNSLLNIEAVTLPGASPTAHLKSSHRALSAPGGTGNYDVDIPIGNQIALIGFRLTTFPAASSHTFGIDTFTVKKNNKEHAYIAVDALNLLDDMSRYTINQVNTIAAQGLHVPSNTLFIDFDPLKDGKFLLDTKGLSACVVDAEYGVDEAQTVFFFELESN